MWTSFKRTVRSGFVGFWRNAFVSLSAIFVMIVTLFVIGSVLFVGKLLNASFVQLTDKVDVDVRFVVAANTEEILALKSSLEALPEVKGVTYISREEALQQFTERNQTNAAILQALKEVGENPLSATLRVKAKETEQYETIVTFLEEKRSVTTDFIDRINYQDNKQAIDTLTRIMDTVDRVSFITTLALVIASILITFNTIRLAIYTSREEITVMRLVGAGNMFIRGPFILQGIMYGAAAGLITMALFYPLTLWLGERTASFFEFNIFTYYIADIGHIFFVVVGSGMLLGAISSTLAIARYLRS